MAKGSPKSPAKRPRLMKPAVRADLMDLFGARLKKLMLLKGISEINFCDLSGIDEGNLRKYLSGKREPTLSTIEIMADALGVTAMELIDTGFKMERKVEARASNT